MATLFRRAELMRNGGDPHSNIGDPINRQQRLRRASRDTRQVIAQQTGRLIGENNRCAIMRMRDNRPGWAGLGAVAAFRTTLQKERTIDGAGRPQPIGADRRWDLCGSGISLFGKFLRRFGDRENRVLKKIAPAI